MKAPAIVPESSIHGSANRQRVPSKLLLRAGKTTRTSLRSRATHAPRTQPFRCPRELRIAAGRRRRSRKEIRVRRGDLGNGGVQLARRDDRLRPLSDDRVETLRDERLRDDFTASAARSPDGASEFRRKRVEVNGHVRQPTAGDRRARCRWSERSCSRDPLVWRWPDGEPLPIRSARRVSRHRQATSCRPPSRATLQQRVSRFNRTRSMRASWVWPRLVSDRSERELVDEAHEVEWTVALHGVTGVGHNLNAQAGDTALHLGAVLRSHVLRLPAQHEHCRDGDS